MNHQHLEALLDDTFHSGGSSSSSGSDGDSDACDTNCKKGGCCRCKCCKCCRKKKLYKKKVCCGCRVWMCTTFAVIFAILGACILYLHFNKPYFLYPEAEQ